MKLDGTAARIDAFSDLLMHDLGENLADRRADHRSISSRWRTAPLWGMAQALQFGDVALLHDAAPRASRQAILWHGGQAAAAQRAFQQLSAVDRACCCNGWVRCEANPPAPVQNVTFTLVNSARPGSGKPGTSSKFLSSRLLAPSTASTLGSGRQLTCRFVSAYRPVRT